jgi:hypothetical protein
MNELLAIRSHWSEANLKLIMNSRPIFPELYLDEFETADGRIRRAVAAKVDVFLSMGASLVANSVDEVRPKFVRSTPALPTTFRRAPARTSTARSKGYRPSALIVTCMKSSPFSAKARKAGTSTKIVPPPLWSSSREMVLRQ